MRKLLRTIFAVIWVLCFVFLGVYFVFFTDGKAVFSESENRNLKGMPEFTVRTYMSGNLDDDTESYLADHIIYRKEAIDLYNKMRDKLSLASYKDSLVMMAKDNDGLTKKKESVDKDKVLEEAKKDQHIGTKRVKPQVNIDDFSDLLTMDLNVDGEVWSYYYFDKYNVLALTNVLNRIAACLPEDGELVFTMVPQAAVGNIYANAGTKSGFYSYTEDLVEAFGSSNVQAVNATNILGKYIEKGGYAFFRSDMHWTPKGTHEVYAEMVKKAGLTPVDLSAFNLQIEEPFLGTYYRDEPTQFMADNPDTLELYSPKFNLRWLRCTGPDQFSEIDFLDFNAAFNDRYTVYLGGPAGPWTYADCDNGLDRNCLVICDSFGLGFVPQICANYKQVHYYDPRYYDYWSVGYTVKEMIEKYSISDVYVVIGDLHSYDNGFIIDEVSAQLGD